MQKDEAGQTARQRNLECKTQKAPSAYLIDSGKESGSYELHLEVVHTIQGRHSMTQGQARGSRDVGSLADPTIRP